MSRIRFFIYSAVLLTFVIGTQACIKMNDYEKFQVNGPIRYPAKVAYVENRPGNNRIMLRTVLGGDPSVVKMRIFWNNNTDSVEVPITPSTKRDTVETIITKLTETVHNFNIYTYDIKGNKSVLTNAVGPVYGDIFKSSLTARDVKVSNSKAGLILTFSVNNDTTQAVTKLTYTNTSSVLVTKNMLPSVIKDTLRDNSGSSISLVTTYIPGYKNNGIDQFSSPVKDLSFNRFAGTYTEVGTLSRPGVADAALANDVVLTAVDNKTAWAQAAINIFNNASLTYYIVLNDDNTVEVKPDPEAAAAGISINAIAPASTYDPVNKKFTLNYEYLNRAGAYRRFSTTLELK